MQADPELDALAESILTELVSANPDDFEAVERLVRQLATEPTALADYMTYKHIPVGPREFVLSKQFLDAGDAMWPAVLNEFEEMNSGKYTEVVLTGGIGVAKTTLAVYTQAYQLYRLSCLRNVHKTLDQDPSAEILIVVQSLNEALAQEVGFARLKSLIESAPYFKNHWRPLFIGQSRIEFPHNIIIKPVSGSETGAIGQNVIGGIIDELNFMAVVQKSSKSHNNSIHNQAIENYNSIARRRESRFQQFGMMPGMLCLVSSRNYPGQFTDIKEAEAKHNPLIHVYDKRLWELRPERFTGKTFNIFVGDETRRPRILAEDEMLPVDDRHLQMAIPVEYRDAFRNDIVKAIRDIAGRSAMVTHPFLLNVPAVMECFGKVESVLSRPDCDFDLTSPKVYRNKFRFPEEPRFAHVDLAITGDSAGVVIGFVSGFKDCKREEGVVERLPVCDIDCALEIRPPKGGEILFTNVRKVIYGLRDKGLNIKWVTFDTFQSTDSMQMMRTQNFATGTQSMDVDLMPYEVMKQAFYDGRIRAPLHPKLMEELQRLEKDIPNQKIDHPPNGSKDVADALAGVVYGLTMRREIWVRHGVSTHNIPVTLQMREEKARKGSITAQERTWGTEMDRAANTETSRARRHG